MQKNIYILGQAIAGSSNNFYGVPTTYLQWIRTRIGNPKILMPEATVPPDDCDLLILPGGKDLTPESYNQIPEYRNSDSDQFKQHFYNKCLDNYIEAKIPIFGICLGFQMIMAKFKAGNYVQNLEYHPSSADRYKKGHEIYILSKTFLNDYDHLKNQKEIGRNAFKMEVNSHHHQGILCTKPLMEEKHPDIIVDGFYYNGVEDIVEAAYHKSLPIAGVQYHPEESYSGDMEAYALSMINYLLNFNNKKVHTESKVYGEESN